MPMSTDVTLPRDATPVFPDFCCVCAAPRPGSWFEARGRRIHFAELLMPWLWFFGVRVTVNVPVCAGCRPGAIAGRRWAQVVMLLWLVAVAALVLPWLDTLGLARGTKRLVGGLALLAGSAPVVLWWVLRPPAFDLTVGKQSIDYEFASRDYALRFLAANPGAKIG